MPACPYCLGEGEVDLRDDDACWAEQFSDAELAALRERGLNHPVGVVACDECEQTGVVSKQRLREIDASSRACIDQALAEMYARGLA